jgi:hypothetical protein
MNKIQKIKELISQGKTEADLYIEGHPSADIKEAQKQLKQEAEVAKTDEFKPLPRTQVENQADWLIGVLADSVDRLTQKAVNPDDTRIDIQAERQIQQNTTALWKMLQDVGEIQPSKETHFTFEIVDSIELEKENQEKH